MSGIIKGQQKTAIMERLGVIYVVSFSSDDAMIYILLPKRTIILVLSASLQTFTHSLRISDWIPLLLRSSFRFFWKESIYQNTETFCTTYFGAHRSWTSPPIMHNIRQNQVINWHSGKENKLILGINDIKRMKNWHDISLILKSRTLNCKFEQTTLHLDAK